MSITSTPDQLQKDLASLADNFERITHPKWNELLPFKESIAEFRKRGASFKAITIILRNKSISVSHDTVARFCYAFVGPKPRRKGYRARRDGRTRKTEVGEGDNNSGRIQRKSKPSSSSEMPPPSNRERGPRIARVQDL
jgi:hypothetical protein